MVEAVPSAYVATMTKAKRNGKIFIDFFRNDYTATAIADYAVRARPGAPVALPLSWKELDDLESGSQFTMKDVLARLKRKKPPAVPSATAAAQVMKQAARHVRHKSARRAAPHRRDQPFRVSGRKDHSSPGPRRRAPHSRA